MRPILRGTMSESVTFSPIGVVRTPFPDRVSAPRQPYAARGMPGTIELYPGRGFEHALCDLEGWDYVWVVFWFHLNVGWRPKVLPPRSTGKRHGVFATRSPHRPNPIGLSVVRLDRILDLTLHVRDVDMVDGTPVLDLKPYLPVADAIVEARTGWLGAGGGIIADSAAPSRGMDAPADPAPGYEVAWSDRAAEQARWLRADQGVDLEAPVVRALSLGPQPHPYRRIRAEPGGSGMRLAVKDWRVRFHVEGRLITVDSITTGYRERELVTSEEEAVAPHRAFVARFGR